MSGTFQNTINYEPAPGVEGDFANVNPFESVPPPISSGTNAVGHVAGAGGVIMGRMGWIQADGITVLNSGTGKPSGFVRRQRETSLVTAYLGATTMAALQGRELTLYDGGHFYARSTTASTRAQKVYASNTTGLMQTAATGQTIAGFIETDWFVVQGGLANELMIITRRTVS